MAVQEHKHWIESHFVLIFAPMNYGKTLGTFILIILIPIYSGGISVVKHFCCGVVENTEFLFGVHTTSLPKDNHHEKEEESCCDTTPKDQCCDSEHDSNKCGDEILTFDSNDTWIIPKISFDDTHLNIIVLPIITVFSENQLPSFSFLSTIITHAPPEHELAHSITVLRL